MSKRYTISDGKLVLNLQEAEEGGYIVTSPLEPELITEAQTVPEAFSSARDAIKGLRRSRRKLLGKAPWAALLLVLAVSVLCIAQEKPSSPATSSAPSVATLPGGGRTLKDVEYTRPDGKSVLLDLYLPRKTDTPAPVVVWIHGGAWKMGDKKGCPAALLVARGYAAASINYRLTDVAPMPAQVHDCKAAIRWVRASAEKYDLDPNRIGVWGASAGGHLAALLGTSGDVKELEGEGGNPAFSSRVQAVCDFFGPTDLAGLASAAPKAMQDSERSPLAPLLGGSFTKNRDKAVQGSPVTHVSKDDPPFLIVHGDKDPLVPLRQSELLHEALKKAGVESTFHVVEGAGHGFTGKNALTTGIMVAEFFDKHLRGVEAPRQPATQPGATTRKTPAPTARPA